MDSVKCTMSYDEVTQTVKISHGKYGGTLMVIKLEAGKTGTMTRMMQDPLCDHDNYWMAVKPADCVVFEQNLFGRTKLQIASLVFNLVK